MARFIDQEPRFPYVPSADVTRLASEQNAISDNLPDVELGQPSSRNAPAPSGDSAEAILRRAYHDRRILVAEDDPNNGEVITELVSGAGLAVDAAKDGVEAVELACSSRYDLVLMDMQMPRINGLDATRRLGQLAGYANVPILALTANVFAEDRDKCIEAGMNDFIAKPVEPEALYKTLVRWLARRH